MMNQKDLTRSWQDSGICEGDIVLIHSSVSRTARMVGGAATYLILDSFREAVGPKGILLLPTFNFGFCIGTRFDVLNTKSEMGALTEAARKIRGRTGHPVYSFSMVSELGQPEFDNYEAFGDQSPFHWLHKNNGKIAVLDLSERESMTFYHYVEQSKNVPYRHHKEFEGEYTDWNGKTETKRYSIFVRDLKYKTAVNPMGELCWSRGLYSGNRPGNKSGLRVINAAAMYLATEEVIADGKARGMLYEDAPNKDVWSREDILKGGIIRARGDVAP